MIGYCPNHGVVSGVKDSPNWAAIILMICCGIFLIIPICCLIIYLLTYACSSSNKCPMCHMPLIPVPPNCGSNPNYYPPYPPNSPPPPNSFYPPSYPRRL